jgi:hypothetical protein
MVTPILENHRQHQEQAAASCGNPTVWRWLGGFFFWAYFQVDRNKWHFTLRLGFSPRFLP